jgi:hypothetical protein
MGPYSRYLLQAVLSVLLAASSFSAPADDLRTTIAAGGAGDLAHAPTNLFLRAFTAVALRAKSRDLPAYVEAGIKMRPELTFRIVARAIRLAARKDPTSSCSLISRIVQAAITANPDETVEIVNTAIAARPALVHCIIEAATAIAPDQQSAIAALETNFSLGLLSLTANAEIGPWQGSGTLNPANVSDLRNGAIVSPEQPPKP